MKRSVDTSPTGSPYTIRTRWRGRVTEVKSTRQVKLVEAIRSCRLEFRCSSDVCSLFPRNNRSLLTLAFVSACNRSLLTLTFFPRRSLQQPKHRPVHCRKDSPLGPRGGVQELRRKVPGDSARTGRPDLSENVSKL